MKISTKIIIGYTVICAAMAGYIVYKHKNPNVQIVTNTVVDTNSTSTSNSTSGSNTTTQNNVNTTTNTTTTTTHPDGTTSTTTTTTNTVDNSTTTNNTNSTNNTATNTTTHSATTTTETPVCNDSSRPNGFSWGLGIEQDLGYLMKKELFLAPSVFGRFRHNNLSATLSFNLLGDLKLAAGYDSIMLFVHKPVQELIAGDYTPIPGIGVDFHVIGPVSIGAGIDLRKNGYVGVTVEF